MVDPLLGIGDLSVFDLLRVKCAPTTIEFFAFARFGAADLSGGTRRLPEFAV
jgi:hypothetical protein